MTVITISGGTTVISTTVVSTTSYVVEDSGQLVIANGGLVSHTTATSSGEIEVSAGGRMVQTTLESGGFDYVFSGGIASATTVSNGGEEAVGFIFGPLGGSAIGTIVDSGGLDFAQSGGVITSAVVNNSGAQDIEGGGVASHTTVNNGGTVNVSAGGSSFGTIISSGGTETVNGMASGTIVRASGSQVVANGGVATGTVVSSGGTELIQGGGIAVSASAGSGGSIVIDVGGTLELVGGATLNGVTVYGGGALKIGSGYVLSGFTVADGITLEVASGGNVSNVTVASGGTLELFGGANVSGALISAGGTLGVASGDTISNFVGSSGVTLAIAAGGSASATIISNGGLEVVRGTTSDATIEAGGSAVVSSGGSAAGTTSINGGTLTVAAGAAAGTVDFLGSGVLQLDGPSISGGLVIEGLTAAATIDLVGLNFDKTGSAELQSGNVLQVTADGSSYNLDLAPAENFSGHNFVVSEDASGGTEVTMDRVTVTQNAIDNRQPSLGLSVFFPLQGSDPSSGGGAFLGEIGIFAGDFAPGSVLAQGQTESISGNPSLYNIIGSRYGGDGSTTFALPDLSGRELIGAGQGTGLSEQDLGVATGFSAIALNDAELPPDDGGSSGSFTDYQASLPVNYIINISGIDPADADGSVDTMGMVVPFAGSVAPAGWAFADGQTLSISQNEALFSIIGTFYGGDGTSTFQLPDLRGRDIIGEDVPGSPDPQYVLGFRSGQSSVALTNKEAPDSNRDAVLPFTNEQPYLVLAYLIALQGKFPGQSPQSLDPSAPYLGEIVAFAGYVVPSGWALAAGQLLSINSNTALYAVLGTAYGGDGVTTFALPDLTGRTVIGLGAGIGIGDQVGSATVTLNVSQLPPALGLLTIGDTLDLAAIGYDSAGTASLQAGNVLQVIENGTLQQLGLDPAQDFTGDYFTLADDGDGGTDVTLEQLPPNVVGSGETRIISAGEASAGLEIESGGTVVVLAGGTAGMTTVSGGGQQYIGSGGTAIGAQVEGGGADVVFGTDSGAGLSGTQYDFGTASGGTTYSGGYQLVGAGAVADVMTVAYGGQQYIGSGGTALGTQIEAGGAEVVFGTDSGASVSGTQYDYGVASGGTTYASGEQLVASGATAIGMTVESGGQQYVGSGGTAIATTVAVQGAQVVFGSALGALVSGTQYDFAYASGGTTFASGDQLVASGATAVGMTVASGGQQYVGSGGTALATTIASQGAEVIFGSDSGAHVSGTQYVFGVASVGTTFDGGSQQVEPGGTANGMTVSAGGQQFVGAGGTAIGVAVLGQGAEVVHGLDAGSLISGTQYVYGVAASDVVGTGGYQLVSSGGTIIGPSISGGTVELQSGASEGAAPITFADAGELILDASVLFSGTVAGFGSASLSDTIDFADIGYVASGSAGATTVAWSQLTSGTNASGTLLVAQGGHSADITLLGQYAVGQFTPSSDGHGGTLITDPPVVTAATDPNPQALARPA